MITLMFDHPTLEATINAGITTFCQRGNIAMPKNGDTVALAYAIAKDVRPYGMMFTHQIHLTDDLFIQPKHIDDERHTCEWLVYRHCRVVIDGVTVDAPVHVANFGWSSDSYKHEPAEYGKYCYLAVMRGNENTPTWEQMYYDRELFYVEFERQNIEKINAGR
jgi:hypothetical protein